MKKKNLQPLNKIPIFHSETLLFLQTIIKDFFVKNMCQKTRKKDREEKKEREKLFSWLWKTYKSIERSLSSGVSLIRNLFNEKHENTLYIFPPPVWSFLASRKIELVFPVVFWSWSMQWRNNIKIHIYALSSYFFSEKQKSEWFRFSWHGQNFIIGKEEENGSKYSLKKVWCSEQILTK